MAICTLFDSKFMVEGTLCIRSILKHCYGSPVYVLCLDRLSYILCRDMTNKNGLIKPIDIYDFEQSFPTLHTAKPSRPWNAYTQTLKVFLPSFIFNQFKESYIVYVDSDMLFWSDQKPINLEMIDYSFMVTSREQKPCPSQGCYNGGFFACKNDDNTKDFLNWWQEKTLDWCLWQSDGAGRFTEEGYLNVIHEAPDMFKSIHIAGHPGINLAPWNVAKHEIEVQDDCTILIDKKYPLVCYHYWGFQLGNCNDCFDPGVHIKSNGAWFIYDHYHKKFRETKKELLDGLDKQWR